MHDFPNAERYFKLCMELNPHNTVGRDGTTMSFVLHFFSSSCTTTAAARYETTCVWVSIDRPFIVLTETKFSPYV